VADGSVGFSIGRGKNLQLGIKQTEVSCAVAHTLNTEEDSELLIDVFARSMCRVEAKNDCLWGNAYLLRFDSCRNRR
jgi:hypothetical protein